MSTADAELPPPAAPRASILRDLRFVRLWCASTCSGLATWAVIFVLGLGVAQRRWDAELLGLLLALRSAGFLVALPFAGVAADRLPRRAVTRAAALGAAVGSALLVVGITGRHTLVASVGVALVGVGQAACRPSFQALVRDQVAETQRQAANAAMSVSVRATTLLGPGLTALASRWVDLDVVLASLAVLWVGTALLPAADRTRPDTATATRTERLTARALARQVRSDLLEGVAEARRHRWFTSGLGALLVVLALGYSATHVALPLVSRDRFGGEAVLAGSVTAYTVGALAGGLLMSRWTPRNTGWWAFAGLACYGLVPLTLALSHSPLLVLAVYALAGVGIEVFNVPWFTATQREVPPDRLARVSSLDFLVSYGLAPVGLALLAPAIQAWGATPVLVGCGGACLLATAAAATVPTARTLRG